MDLMAFLISALSLLIAGFSLVWAIQSGRSSDKLAQEANEKADAANRLSVDANTIAKQSQRIAEDSGVVGKESLTVAHRAEARQSDTSNIHWDGDWKEPGVYTIVNRGDDDALDVRIILTVDDEEIRVSQECVPGGGAIDVECPRAAEAFRREVAERREEARRRAQLQQSGNYFGVGVESPFKYSSHFIGERIDWVSQRGKPGTHEENYSLSALGTFD